MIRCFATVMFVLAGARLSGAPVADPPTTLVSRIESVLQEARCPGALVGVFHDEGRPWIAAIGSADADGHRPMRLDMRMRIGSATKLFVGTAALRLVDRGMMSLDDPVAAHLEGVPSGERITLRMLGDQTSGLFDPIADPAFQAEILDDPKRIWRPEEVLAFACCHPLRNEPGEAFRYSNTGTVVLGQVLEAVTGKSLPEVVHETVCEPLGLKNTFFCTAASPPTPTPSAYRFGDDGRWLGYGDVFFDVTGYSASWSSWAGDMYSTLQDLGRATKPLATGHLLSDASRAELHAWTRFEGDRSGYGFLISRDQLGVGHDGDVPGFNAVVRYSPARRASLVVLTNLSNNADGSMPAEALASLVWPADSTPSE